MSFLAPVTNGLEQRIKHRLLLRIGNNLLLMYIEQL